MHCHLGEAVENLDICAETSELYYSNPERQSPYTSLDNNNELKRNLCSFVASVFMFSISIAMFYSYLSFISDIPLQFLYTSLSIFVLIKRNIALYSFYSFEILPRTEEAIILDSWRMTANKHHSLYSNRTSKFIIAYNSIWSRTLQVFKILQQRQTQSRTILSYLLLVIFTFTWKFLVL